MSLDLREHVRAGNRHLISMSILVSLLTWDRQNDLEQLQMKKEAQCGG